MQRTYVALLERPENDLPGLQPKPALRRVEPQLNNIGAAAARLREEGAAAEGFRLMWSPGS
jgi:hypothetical protein